MMSRRNWARSLPTQITYGRRDVVTSTRFADLITGAIPGSELLIFEECSHTPIYEKVEEFNQKALAFLQRHAV
jgi:2-hydroxy-6-oxonona-2,4-dienedioate hydrolase